MSGETRRESLVMYVREDDVDAYTAQGWVCHRLTGHHGWRKNGRNFICVLERGDEKHT